MFGTTVLYFKMIFSKLNTNFLIYTCLFSHILTNTVQNTQLYHQD